MKEIKIITILTLVLAAITITAIVIFVIITKVTTVPIETESGLVPLTDSIDFEASNYSKIPDFKKLSTVINEYGGEIIGVNYTALEQKPLYTKVFYEVEDEEATPGQEYETIYCIFNNNKWEEIKSGGLPEKVKKTLDKKTPTF